MKTEDEIQKMRSAWQDIHSEFFVLREKAPTDELERDLFIKMRESGAWMDALLWVLEESDTSFEKTQSCKENEKVK